MSTATERPERWSSRLMAGYLAIIITLLLIGMISPAVDQGNRSGQALFLADKNASPLSPVMNDSSLVPTSENGGDKAAAAPETSSEGLLTGNAEEPDRRSGRTDLGLADFDFDLAENGGINARGSGPSLSSGKRIEVRKTVVADGKQVGAIAVTIDDNARLFMNGADVASILPADQPRHPQLAAETASGLISFQRLRELGVNLRYDPVADRIELGR